MLKVKARIAGDKVIFANAESDKPVQAEIANFHASNSQYQLIIKHQRYIFAKINHQALASRQNEGNIVAPMPGKILQIKVKTGDTVKADETIIVMEAMKMELALKASVAAKVMAINVKENDVITADTVLIALE